MFDSIQTAMAYAGGETDAVRKCDPRLFDSDTGQGNRHDVSWAKMQLSLYVIENEAAIAAVPGAIRTTLAVWLSARGHGVAHATAGPRAGHRVSHLPFRAADTLSERTGPRPGGCELACVWWALWPGLRGSVAWGAFGA